jgi:hypothetical protein
MRTLLVLVILLLAHDRADACACCDATMSRRPVGWSASGDVVLIDTSDTTACEPHSRYEIWQAGAAEPTGCYDRFGDPEKQIACDQITADWQHELEPKASTRVKLYPARPVQVEGAKLKVNATPFQSANGVEGVRVIVRVGGMQLLDEELEHVSQFHGVTVWRSPKNDRVLLLISYTRRGSGNAAVDVRWAELKKS